MTHTVVLGVAAAIGLVLVVTGALVALRHAREHGGAAFATTLLCFGTTGLLYAADGSSPGSDPAVVTLLAAGVAALLFTRSFAPATAWELPLAAGAAAIAVVVAFVRPSPTGGDVWTTGFATAAFVPPMAVAARRMGRRAAELGPVQMVRLRALASAMYVTAAALAAWFGFTAMQSTSTGLSNTLIVAEGIVLLAVAVAAMPPRWIHQYVLRVTAGAQRDVLERLLQTETSDPTSEVLQLAVELAGLRDGCVVAGDEHRVLAIVGDPVTDPEVLTGCTGDGAHVMPDGRLVRCFVVSVAGEDLTLALTVRAPSVLFAHDDARRVERFVAAVAPQLERAELHAQIARQQREHATILDAVGSLGQGYVITAGRRIVEASSTLHELLGYPDGGLLELVDATHLVTPEDRQDLAAVSRAVRAGTRENAQLVVRALRRDGSTRQIEVSMRSLGPQAGRPRMLTLVRDVSAPLAELARETRRARQLSAFAHLARAVVGAFDGDAVRTLLADAAHDVLDARSVALVTRGQDDTIDIVRSGPGDPDVETTVGRARAELIGDEPGAAMITSPQPGVWLVRVFGGGRLEGALVVRRPAGASSFDDLDHAIAENLSVLAAHGLAGVRQFEDEVDARQRLAASYELQTGLLASVAHDLRTPLHLISGTAETLLAHADRLEADARRELLTRMQRTAERTHRLLEDLLDVERDALGVLEVQTEPVDLLAFAHGAVAHLPPELIPQVEVVGEPVLAAVDVHRAERIVENLVGNAAKYSPDGSVITVRVSSNDGVPCLAVEDHGEGVPERDRTRIFHAFQRLPNASARATGVGLGLHVVAVLARAQGAAIGVEDVPGGGASFRVYFRSPVASADASRDERNGDTLTGSMAPT